MFRLLYVSGHVKTVIEFDNRASWLRWQDAVNQIKATVAQNNEDFYDVGRVTVATHRSRALQWLETVYAFRDEYGVDKVPDDIRFAANDTERFLGRQETVW